MDIHDLMLSCRRGDISRVQYLVDQKEVDLNCRDRWDSSPLYYACLCGHEELVQYMLENGAKCEANTFDGERCLYGALNDQIKKLLKSYKQVTSATMRRDGYTEFLRMLLDRGTYADIIFNIHGECIPAHRCILLARSPYFQHLFTTRWEGKGQVHLKNKLVTPWAFRSILSYLYTGSLEVEIEQIEDLFRLAKQCQLHSLMEELTERFEKDISFESSKPGVHITMISLKPRTDVLQNNMGLLADHCLPKQLCNEGNEALPFPERHINTYPDIIFSVDGVRFHCHKTFFCGRSDYFNGIVADHFGEFAMEEDNDGDSCTEQESALPVYPLHNITVDTFVQVMYYMYQATCLQLTESNVYDVMCVADLYMLPGLKRLCANGMAQYLDMDNIIMTLRTAQLFNLPRLEDQCADFLASNIEKMVQCKEFADFVMEDANKVQGREETDSIPIIDDIRYHIQDAVQTFSDMYEADNRLSLIDSFLDELQLDA